MTFIPASVRPGKNRSLVAGALALAAALAALSGCEGEKPRLAPIPINAQARISANLHPALRETVGEFATVATDAAPIAVEGYGIIANLHGNGSSDMDPKIREKLVDQLVRAGAGWRLNDTQHIDPEAILSSRDIAVVEVRGIIPPLARKGSTFDLSINALPNSQATSLANGLLWTTELKIVGLTTEQNDTATIALGRGPVFIPTPVEAIATPEKLKDPADLPRSLRAGRILGGGVLATDRPIRLQLYAPDASRTRAIEYTINARFPGRDVVSKTAAANDDITVSLRIPPEYEYDAPGFIDLVKHMYFGTANPGFAQAKAAEIIKALQEPDSPKRDLSVALQGLGRGILPEFVQPQYTSPDLEVRFWCARAGAAMQDVGGMLVLQEMVADKNNPMRQRALEALVQTSLGRDTVRTSLTLAEMLKSPNTDERIAAYRGLLAMRSRLVMSYAVPGELSRPDRKPTEADRPRTLRKFWMDIVPADSPPLIYVSQADEPRIAFIGRPLSLPTGAVYVSEDRLLTVVSNENVGDAVGTLGDSGQVLTAASVSNAPAAPQERVTLFYRQPNSSRTVNIKTVSSLPAIIARAAWEPDPTTSDDTPYIAASYQRMAEMLATMCRENTLNAKFVLGPAPQKILTQRDLITGGRPEGSTAPATAPATAPSTTEPAQ
jgi:flagellar basal body P-ring protein FlgI